MAIEKVTAQNFNEKVKNNSGLTVVDFFATWCGPCKMLAPILEETASEYGDVTFCKVDIDEEMSLATRIPDYERSHSAVLQERGSCEKIHRPDFTG